MLEKYFETNGNDNRLNINLNKDTQTFSIVADTQIEVIIIILQ